MSSELDLRGLHREHAPDPAFVERLRVQLEAALAEIGADGESPAVVELPLDPPVSPPRPTRRRVVILAAAAAVVVAVVGTLLSRRANDPDDTTFAGGSAATLAGTWVSTDLDGSSQTMQIAAAGDNVYRVVVNDDSASVCSGAPSTMIGTAHLDAAGALVIARPELVCDDGSSPTVDSGLSLEEALAAFTVFYDPTSDKLYDTTGVVWTRAGSDPVATAGTMWPQSSREEVSEAQRLADAGDSGYTWQVDPALAADDDLLGAVRSAEIFSRFLREELRWEEFLFTGIEGELSEGSYTGVEFIRCATGRTNPLYADDPTGGRCAPTLGEVRYETVRIDVAQLERRDPTGIWVVARWRMSTPFAQTVPPSEEESAELLDAFLEARVAGEGAERYLWDSPVPLLYATSAGAPYERFEIEAVDGSPDWPRGEMVFRARLLADGGSTVVEQLLVLGRDPAGRLVIYASTGEPRPAPGALTENGQPVAEAYEFLDGEVTFSAPWPWTCCGRMDWDHSPTLSTLYLDSQTEGVALLADPLPVGTGCATGAPAVDAAALAAAIAADTDFEATPPVEVSVGGIDALQVDVTELEGASDCDAAGPALLLAGDSTPGAPAGVWGDRARIYVLDVPDASARILAIAVFAHDDQFDRVLDAAAPILESLELETG